jgi:diguanylate cyclase (GGDEF)-like protein
MRAVAIARLDLCGRTLHANNGFYALVGGQDAADPSELPRRFIHPAMDELLERARTVPNGNVVFAGVISLAGEDGDVRSLRATVIRDRSSILIVGERDVTGLERLSGTLLTLNEELMRRGRELVRLNRTLREREAELSRLAATDQLTGLANRRTLLSRLRSELALSAELGRPVCVALADIDRFKQMNDGHGHETGDTALVTLSGILRTGLRSQDLVGRWGGEEFLIVLGGTRLHDAVAILERLGSQVREQTARSFVCPFTVSFGVCEAAPGEDPILLVRRTDQALYMAKGAGRDLVSTGTPRRADAAA